MKDFNEILWFTAINTISILLSAITSPWIKEFVRDKKWIQLFLTSILILVYLLFIFLMMNLIIF